MCTVAVFITVLYSHYFYINKTGGIDSLEIQHMNMGVHLPIPFAFSFFDHCVCQLMNLKEESS